MSAPLVVETTDEHCIATYENIVFVRWKKLIRVPAVEKMQLVLHDLTQSAPAKAVGLVTMIAKGCEAPNEQSRRAIVAYDPKTRYVPHAMILEVTGFMGSVVRSVMAGLSLMKRTEYPESFFKDGFVASAWLEQKLVKAGGRCPLRAHIAESIFWMQKSTNTTGQLRTTSLGQGTMQRA